MAASAKSKLKGHIDKNGVEWFFFTSELLEETFFIVVEHLSEEEQAKMTRVHQSEVPPLVTTKMDSFPFFYFFPQSDINTNCTVTSADLEAMEEIFSEAFNGEIAWPSGKCIAHCPYCGFSDVYLGVFCIQPMIKGHFQEETANITSGYEISICRHFMPRVFHKECYVKLTSQAFHFDLPPYIVFPTSPYHASNKKIKASLTKYKFPILTEQWLGVQKLVRALDVKMRGYFMPEILFTYPVRRYLSDAVCLEKFLKNVTYQQMVHIARIAGQDLGATQEDFEHTSLPTDAEHFRNEGNRALSSNDFNLAINFYTKSILACPTNYISWSQRSRALSGLKQFEESLLDCEECTRLNPKWIQGYLFKAWSQLNLERYEDALSTLIQAGNIDPLDEDVANKLVTAVNLSYNGSGIVHFVDVIEDDRYKKFHTFIGLLCHYVCQICKIEVKNTGHHQMTYLHTKIPCNLTLDQHNAARLAHRLEALGIPGLKEYELVFKTIAGAAFNDLIKAKKGKKTIKESIKGKQLHTQAKINKPEVKPASTRLVALQRREQAVLIQMKINRDRGENARITLKRALCDERKILDQELEIIRKCKSQLEEDCRRVSRGKVLSSGLNHGDLSRQIHTPCSRRYTPTELRELPWRLIESALKNGLLNVVKVGFTWEEVSRVVKPFSENLSCGSHSHVGVILAEFLLGSYGSEVCSGSDRAILNEVLLMKPLGSDPPKEREIGMNELFSMNKAEIKNALMFPIRLRGLPDLKELDSTDHCLSHLSPQKVHRTGDIVSYDLANTDAMFKDALSSLENPRLEPVLCTTPGHTSEMDGVLEERASSLSSEPSNGGKKRKCANCGAESCKLGKCGRCRKVYYCNADCQKLHHNQHRQTCK